MDSPSASRADRLGALRSRVGRRVLATFVLCAVLPLLTFAAFSFLSVGVRLQEDATEQLRWTSKQVGMGVLERLMVLESELALISEELDPARTTRQLPARSAEGMRRRFVALVRSGPEGQDALLGDGFEPVAPGPAEERQLDGGGTALRTLACPTGVCVEMLHPLPGAGRALIGRVNPTYLWGPLAEASPFETTVLDARGRLLFASGAEDEERFGALVDRVSDGSVDELEHRGEGELAAAWDVFLRPRFGGDDWTVVSSQPLWNLRSPVRAFARTFLLVLLLSLFVVVFLSLVQIRRSLGPIRALQSSTQEIAAGNLAERVVIESGDEFETLGARFNTMAGRLERGDRQARALEALGVEALQATEPVDFFVAAVHTVRRSLDAECCAFWEPERSGGDAGVCWRRRAQSGWPAHSPKREPWRIEGLAAPPEPQAVADFSVDPLFLPPGSLSELSPRSGIRVGIPGSDGPAGVLAVFSAEVGWFGEPECRYLRAVAQLVGTALDRARAELALHESREQLLQSQKLEAIGQLASGVAHDFNNVLTAITGSSEMALEELDASSPAHQEVREIQAAALRGARLASQLLGLSRKPDLEPSALDLGEVVGELAAMLRRLLRGDIRLEVQASRDLAPVISDRGQIEQVVMNLVVNARDALPEGGTIQVDVANVDLDAVAASRFPEIGPGRYVAITVLDDGIGVPEEIREKIFDPFFTTKERGSGTGLGLATVAEIVRKAGGGIDVWSEPGAWTRFEVVLPAADATAAPESSPMPPPGVGTSRDGTETILVVDDDAAVLLLATRTLENAGYEILQARSGAEALAIAERAEIDLLMTDHSMPGMTGRELADRLRRLQPGVPVLLVSGDPDETAPAAGIATLPKPFGPKALVAAARETLGAEDREQGSSPARAAVPRRERGSGP